MKSVEWHSVIDNKFFEVHSNLSRVILEVNAKSVTPLVRGIEKLETLRGQVKAYLDARSTDNPDCVSKVCTKVDKTLYKIGNKISDCAALADQQIQTITDKKIDLGAEILETSEMLLSGTLHVIMDHFATGGSFNELTDIRAEYEEAIEEANEEIYKELIPNINEEFIDIRDMARDIPNAIELCVNNVLMKLNDVVGDTGRMVDRCSKN